MSRKPLSTEEVEQALIRLPNWSYADDALCRSVTLGDFREAVAFMIRVAFEAEQRNHHPALTNVYNRIEIRLNTHDAGNKVTPMDVDLASAIERLVGE